MKRLIESLDALKTHRRDQFIGMSLSDDNGSGYWCFDTGALTLRDHVIANNWGAQSGVFFRVNSVN